MIAEGLFAQGAQVIVAGRKTESLERARRSGLKTVQVDLARDGAPQSLAEHINRDYGRLDVLINNAGTTWGRPIAEFPVSGWDKVVDLNVRVPFLLTQALLPTLTRSGTADNPSRVIMIGSIDGGLRVPETPSYSYSASKAAVHQLTRHLARDLGESRITVNAIAPGPFESRMMDAVLAADGNRIAALSPLGRIGRPEDVVGAATYLASKAGAYLTGAIIPVDGGIATTA
ncbi:NAD(P)-dependent dehydrogenase (short-subunit alcohol dehydrogenase family) [Gordonia humi]|uniref:NAD(P)-dependent dehydrogenase (Short-subunit alcohol dehydrogenase family) n=2 Tax=Gordonia humi TaxID=686429 RepID=A0A840ERT7_9ACTN|nr:NAD(P)-dependent dehydrogenase (short-subunit alcohol dehydrogenase family) [Gordonia humi]